MRISGFAVRCQCHLGKKEHQDGNALCPGANIFLGLFFLIIPVFSLSQKTQINRATAHISIPGLKMIFSKGFCCKNEGYNPQYVNLTENWGNQAERISALPVKIIMPVICIALSQFPNTVSFDLQSLQKTSKAGVVPFIVQMRKRSQWGEMSCRRSHSWQVTEWEPRPSQRECSTLICRIKHKLTLGQTYQPNLKIK